MPPAAPTDSDGELDLPSTLNTLEVFDPIPVPPDEAPRRRREGRKPLAVRAEVVALGKDLSPLADPVEGTVVDLSKRGIGVVADLPRNTAYFRARIRTRNGRIIDRLYQARNCGAASRARRFGGVAVTNSEAVEARETLARDVFGISLAEWMLFLGIIAFCLSWS